MQPAVLAYDHCRGVHSKLNGRLEPSDGRAQRHGNETAIMSGLPSQDWRQTGALSACPSKNSAISPSSRTSTTARPPSSTAC
ncbi:hypothetical protein XHV734_3887 [Xanthomonas hortorum pv. vitians]|nr:hypothetical protein XHV734_3887 [Xanthomonas hortorum pv. vitians]